MSQFKNPIAVSCSAFPKQNVFKLPSQTVVDKAQVRLGGLSPAFRTASISDKGKVRLGGLGPVFRK